jgi:hypothetical protein
MLIGNGSFGQEPSADPFIRSLRGINGIQVVVEQLDDEAKALGLDRETIQTDAELKIRLAGMPVLADEQDDETPGTPYIYLNVNVVGRAATCSIEFNQRARARTNRGATIATTWSKAS